MKRKELADRLRKYRSDRNIVKLESVPQFKNTQRQITIRSKYNISLPNKSEFAWVTAVDDIVIVTFSITLTDNK
mgnify:CR=1 FL=1